MSRKWRSRLAGLGVIVLIILVSFSLWFRPEVPDALRRDLELQVRGQPSVPERQTEMQPSEPESTQLTPPALTLTSLEDFPVDGGAAPVLANPKTETAATTAPFEAPPKIEPEPPVEEKVPAPEAEAAKALPAAGEEKFIAAGAFGNPDNTRRRVEQLRNRGWAVKVEKIQSGGKTLDRVILGPVSEVQVNAYLDELSKMGIQGREIK